MPPLERCSTLPSWLCGSGWGVLRLILLAYLALGDALVDGIVHSRPPHPVPDGFHKLISSNVAQFVEVLGDLTA